MKKEKSNAVIKLVENGPMLLQGSFEVVGIDGKIIELTTTQQEKGAYLCLCGKSQNKPFCDGSHLK